MGSATTLLLTFLAAAPDSATGRVVGVILEGDHPASWAHAYLLGAKRGAQADDRGAFTIERVPPGTDSLRVTLLGTEPVTREVTVRPGETLDVGTIRLRDPLAASLEGEGPTVLPIDPVLGSRIRRASLRSVDRIDRGTGGAPARLEGYVRVGRATRLPEGWTERLKALLADSTGYRVFQGKVQKVCIFHGDVEVRLADSEGDIDVWLCFGCGDLLIRSATGSGAMRDFGALAERFLDLAVEAFPKDDVLLERRRSVETEKSR